MYFPRGGGGGGGNGKHSEVFLLHSFPDRFTHEFFIKGAYPERALVEQVYASLTRAAAKRDTLPGSMEELMPLIGGKVSPREAESAIRILSQGRSSRFDCWRRRSEFAGR